MAPLEETDDTAADPTEVVWFRAQRHVTEIRVKKDSCGNGKLKNIELALPTCAAASMAHLEDQLRSIPR